MITHLVGVSFRPAEAREIVKTLEEGTVLTLEREASNDYDENAIKVLLDDTHLGYIPKSDNVQLAADLDNGAEFICSMQERISYRDIVLSIEPA